MRSLMIVGLILVMFAAAFAEEADPDANPYTNGGVTSINGRADRIYLKIDFSGSGGGLVQIAPGELECRKDDQLCAMTFKKGTEVVLVAKASGSNSAFSGWIGRCELVEGAGPEACRIRLTEDTKITANFSEERYRTFSFDFPNLLGKSRPTPPSSEN